MNDKHRLHAHLESFVRHGSSLGAEWIEHEFTWPPELLDVANLEIFRGFQWSRVQTRTTSAILGIREGNGAFALSPRILKRSRVAICATRHGTLDVRHAELPRYVIAELAGHRHFCISVFALGLPTSWHFVEERTLTSNMTGTVHGRRRMKT